MNKPRILLITPYFFFPADSGGKVVIINHLELLSQYFEVTTIFPFWNQLSDHHAAGLESLSQRYQIVPINLGEHAPLTRHPAIQNCYFRFRILFSSYAGYGIEYFYKHPKVQNMIKDNFDLIQLEHSWWYHPTLKIRKGKLVLIEHNYEFEYWTETSRASFQRKRFKQAFRDKLCSLKISSQEKEALLDSDLILTVSERDKKILSNLLSQTDKIFVTENGINIKSYCDYLSQNQFPEEKSKKKNTIDLVHAGSLYLEQTADGIIFFINEVLPLLEKSQFTFRLFLIGRDPIPPLRKLATQRKNIILTGYVDDVRPYIMNSDIYIVPLKHGAGVRFKIMEAMALGKPIVSTSKGLEGLNIKGGCLYTADTPKQFSEAILQLVKDIPISSKMNIEYAQKHFDINKLFHEKSLPLYQKLIIHNNPSHNSGE